MGQLSGRILILDDDPAVLTMMSAYLIRRGYQVAKTSTSEEAWSLLQAAPGEFAVAILDGSMPDLSMPEGALRMLALSPALRVLAASGYPVDMTALEAAAPGRVRFLQKPFTPEMLALAVRGMLGAEEEV